MHFRSDRLFLLLMLALSFGCGESGSHSKTGGGDRVARQIDHIKIASNRADVLFNLLTREFQFPVAWPMTDYGGFTSGGVAVGNVNLEVIRSAAAGGRITGFAIEPERLESSLRKLDERGIAYGSHAVFRSGGFMGFGGRVRWTTVALPSVSSGAAEVFLCEYADDVSDRRRKWLEELRSRNGGPLSVVSVKEIVYGAREELELRKQWQAMLAPAEATGPGVWPFGAGPAIRVVKAPEDGILGIVINVRSLSQARKYLAEKGMIREDSPDEITLGGTELDGLTVKVVEVASTDRP